MDILTQQASQALERNCPTCGARRATTLYHPPASAGPVVGCQVCGCVYVAEIRHGPKIVHAGPVIRRTADAWLATSTDLNDLVGCWELVYLPHLQREQAVMAKNARDALDHVGLWRKPPGRLLDFGCGWGFFLPAARQAGWQPYGLEPYVGRALYGRVKARVEVVADTLRDDTFAAEFFDVVTAFQVFEHLPDPAGDLAKLYRMLKPGGVILIEVPNIATWSVKLLGKRHRHFVHDHLNFYSAATLGWLLSNTGFDVVETYSPTRRMSVRHLVTAWGGRYLPRAIAAATAKSLRRAGLWDRTIQLNLGDIVAVVGRKPG